MKIRFFSLIGLILFLTLKGMAQNIDLTDLVPVCKPAIISITTYDNYNNEIASGTAFFINSSGTALSCYHVFEGASKAIVKTYGNKSYLVNNVIAQSKEKDIIKFSISNEMNESFKYLPIEKVELREGESIFVIGNPLGIYENSVSNGIISSIRSTDNGNIIQITAPISPGSSGSPLINKEGKAIGIISSTSKEGQNLNFAISIEEINLLDPVNSLIYPKNEFSELKLTKKDIQRNKWGTSIYVIQGKEVNSEKDETAMMLENSVLEIVNNYSKALVYKNVIIGDISTRVFYIFENNYLSRIEIRNKLYDGKAIRQIPIPLINTINEFVELYKNLKILYGEPIFEIYGENELISNNLEFLDLSLDSIENQIVSNDYILYLRWKDYSEKSDIVLVLGYDKNNQSIKTGMWTIVVKPFK